MILNNKSPCSSLLGKFTFTAILLLRGAAVAFYSRQDQSQSKLLLKPGPSRILENHDETVIYLVLLHLALEYVDDTLALQLSDPSSGATLHFCNAVNEQAAGNQVQGVAEGRGIFIETAILGTMNNPDFQCTIVEAGALSTGAFEVTVQQTVYVTANWTISLSDVTAMVESGFNRGKGGRVRFRSLLQDHPMFTTVDNVEVLERAFTRHPSKNPSTSPSEEPTDMPPARHFHAPSQTPIIAPTRLVTPLLETTSISAVVAPKPTNRTVPPTDASNDGAPAPSSLSDSDAENDVGEIDLLTAAAIAAGCTMILIACFCVIFVRYCSEAEATEKDNGNKAVRLSVRQTRTGRTSKNRENLKGLVPDMVRLDEENMSLANTSLGDQTAGRSAPRYLLPVQRQLIEADDVPMLDSFDDSLYTSNSASPPGVLLDPTDVAKSEAAKETSSSDSLSVLPQSDMPFDEDRLIFQVDYHNSDYSSSESGAVQSSFLLECEDSSSILATETSRGQIGTDTAMRAKKSDDADDAFGIDLFSDNGSGAVAQGKDVNNSYKAKRALQGMKDDERNASPSFLIESGKRSPLKLDFNTEMRNGSNTSFHSLEDHNPRSAAPLTSSPTKRAENLLIFGFRSPPEEKSPGDEEEKREIDFEARDDEKANDRVDERAHLPLDLLADHQLLERSASPSSWSSWKVSQDHAQSTTNIISEDETKSASTTVGPRVSALVEPPFDCQVLASGNVAAADVTRFIPSSDCEYTETSREAEQNHSGDGKKDNISPQEKYPSAAATSTHDNGTGIPGVIPRRDTNKLENRSASYSSTGLSNPWFFEKLEQVLGPRSATADIESLSGRSNRSGKTHKSRNSQQSYRSHKSSRSYNATPSNQRIKAERNIGSAAASVASYGGSSFGKTGSNKPPAPITLGHDLNRLEMQLAALQTETDQVTASSITLSSVGAKTRSTRSSKLTHTGAQLIRKRRVIVEVPPGKLGVVLANRHDGRGTVVSQVRKNSACKGRLTIGDKLVAIDGENVSNLTVPEITQIMMRKHRSERLLTVITPTHHESKSVGTL